MKIDEQSIYEAPITSQLADRLKSGPITLMIASMGTGDENRTRAMRIRSIIKSGPLPAGLAIVQA
jgi:hypothetical protein